MNKGASAFSVKFNRMGLEQDMIKEKAERADADRLGQVDNELLPDFGNLNN